MQTVRAFLRPVVSIWPQRNGVRVPNGHSYGLMSVDEPSISTGSGMVKCGEAGTGTVARLVGVDPTGWEVGYGRKRKSPTI